MVSIKNCLSVKNTERKKRPEKLKMLKLSVTAIIILTSEYFPGFEAPRFFLEASNRAEIFLKHSHRTKWKTFATDGRDVFYKE